MLSSKKFTFGESFLNTDGNVIVPEVENARELGYEAGYQAGYEKAKSEIESDVSAMMTVLNVRLEEVAARQQAAYEFVTNSTLEVVKAIIKKIIPHVFATSGDHEVNCFVEEVLKGLQASGSMVIFVHPELQKPMETLVQEYCAHLGDKLQVIVKKDEVLERTDCRITWDDGGVEHIKSKLLLDVNQALERVIENMPALKEPEEIKEEAIGEQNV